MLLAAFLDLGLPVPLLRRTQRRAGLRDLSLRFCHVRRGAIQPARLSIGSRAGAVWPREIGAIIDRLGDSHLPAVLRRRVIQIVERIGRAEGAVHRRPWRHVVLRQMGRPDMLAACLGFGLGLDFFRVKRVFVSAIPLGRFHQDHGGRWRRGWGPAARRLLRGFQVRGLSDPFEWTTPTGAALICACAVPLPPPPLEVDRVGQAVGHLPVLAGDGVVRLLLGREVR